MNTRTDWKIQFDREEIVRLQGAGFARFLDRPGKRAEWESALGEAQELAAPAAAWDQFPIHEMKHDTLILSNGMRIGGGPVTTVTGGASVLIVAVCTVGAALSQRVEEHQRNKQLLRGVLLDDLGSWAVDQVRQQLCRWLAEDATRQDLHVSTTLSPGESTWPVSEQAVLFSLLDTTSIGVALSPSMVMRPLKSISLIMGMGSNVMGAEGAEHCDYCTINERCGYRARQKESQRAAAV